MPCAVDWGIHQIRVATARPLDKSWKAYATGKLLRCLDNKHIECLAFQRECGLGEVYGTTYVGGRLI
jgi:hypothetical protein